MGAIPTARGVGVWYLVVEDAEAQPGLSFLQLHHVGVFLPHGEGGRHGGHPPLGDVLRCWTREDTAVVQLVHTQPQQDTQQEGQGIRTHNAHSLSPVNMRLFMLCEYMHVSFCLRQGKTGD